MSGHTRGKGPFAKRQRVSPPDSQAPRWRPPRVELSESLVRDFLKFVRCRCDGGIFKMFGDLAAMPPSQRLARNVAKLLSCMSKHDVVDAVDDGLTLAENDALYHLERAGIAVELLGVAYELLDLRRRQHFIPKLDEAMAQARADTPPVAFSVVKQIRDGDSASK